MGTKRIINMNATTDFESDDNIVVDSSTAGTRKMAQSVLKEKLRDDCLSSIHNLTPATDFASGDTIVVDNANDGPRGMDKDVLLAKTAQNALGSIKNLPTAITAFRTGDVIPVDGPSGTAKMAKDDLLRVTAENALKDIEDNSVVRSISDRLGYIHNITWEEGSISDSTGQDTPNSSRCRTGYIPINELFAVTQGSSYVSQYIMIMFYGKSKNYLQSLFRNNQDYFDPATASPTAYYVRIVDKSATTTDGTNPRFSVQFKGDIDYDIEQLSSITGYSRHKIEVGENGYRIYGSEKQASASYMISTEITLPPKKKISVLCKSNTGFSPIASKSGGSYTGLVSAADALVRLYEYTNTSGADMTVCVSGVTKAFGEFCVISDALDSEFLKIDSFYTAMQNYFVQFDTARRNFYNFVKELYIVPNDPATFDKDSVYISDIKTTNALYQFTLRNDDGVVSHIGVSKELALSTPVMVGRRGDQAEMYCVLDWSAIPSNTNIYTNCGTIKATAYDLSNSPSIGLFIDAEFPKDSFSLKDKWMSLACGIDAGAIANGTSKYDEIREFSFNNNLDNKCCALLYNLKKLSYNNQALASYRDPFGIVGGTQYIDNGDNTFSPLDENTFDLSSKISDATGANPIFWSTDLRLVVGNQYSDIQKAKYRAELLGAINASWKKNKGIPVFCWHLENPYYNFIDSLTPTDAYRYIDPGHDVPNEIADNTGDRCGFVDGYPLGKYDNPRQWLDALISDVKSFFSDVETYIGEPIPIVIRLYHECADSWFWWSLAHTDNKSYKTMFDYTASGINDAGDNFVYGFCRGNNFSSESVYLSVIPSAADILGFDYYDSTNDAAIASMTKSAAIVTRASEKLQKPCVMWENGISSMSLSDTKISKLYQGLYSMIANRDVRVSAIMSWSKEYCWYNTPQSLANFAKFYKRNNIILSDAGVNLSVITT